MQERLFTTDQVADLLGTTIREVRQWIDKGWLTRQSGPDGVDRVSERGLIQFLKGRGIDIMQLMVSTAVDNGFRTDPPRTPTETEPDAPDAELLGEQSSDAPRPEVLSADDGQAGPSLDDDVAEALAERQMLTGESAPQTTKQPAPIPAIDLPQPQADRPDEPTFEACYEAQSPEPAAPAEQGEPDLAQAAMDQTPPTQPAAMHEEAIEGPAATEPDDTRANPSEILDPEEMTALLGPPSDGEQYTPAAEPIEDRAEADAEDAGPFVTGAYDIEPPVEQPPVDEMAGEDAESAEPTKTEESPDDLQPPHRPNEEPAIAVELPSEAHAAAVAAQVISAVLDDAVKRGASHVHLHSAPSGPALKLRIDGRLRNKPNFRRLPDRAESHLIARLLELADLTDANPTRPQSGRFTHEVDGVAVAMKLSSFPTTDGPRLTVALAIPSRATADLIELGTLPADVEHIRRLLTSRRGGLLLVCGPTSGDRGEVLRALGEQLTNMGRDVLAVGKDADTPDACNSPLDPVAGYSFRDAARHLAGQDADAIVLAELRDPATVAAAIEAAIDGSMVVAGIAADTAADALGELAEMNIESWPLSRLLGGVITCRKLPRLCEACKRPVRMPRQMPAGLRVPQAELGRFSHASAGCPKCGQTGCDGTVRLVSLLRPDQRMIHLVRAGAGADTIAESIPQAGPSALVERAVRYVRDGDISLDELANLA